MRVEVRFSRIALPLEITCRLGDRARIDGGGGMISPRGNVALRRRRIGFAG